MPYMEQIEAAGRVSTAATAAGTFRGCTVAKGGTGLYDVTLERPCNSAEGYLVVGEGNANDFTFTVTHTSDTVKRITARTGAAAADTTFAFSVRRFAFGAQ